MKRTKILATLGPSTASYEIIKELIKEGINGARLNFSHGDYESHGKMIDMLKAAREELDEPVALVLDTKGPEIRLKSFKEGTAFLEKGSEFVLTTDDIEGDEKRASVTYKDLPKDMGPGGKILLDDGLIELKVKEVKGNNIICTVVNGGLIKNNKGINIPDVHTSLPSLTQKDVDDIVFGIEKGVDFIAASFIRSAADIRNIRRVLDKNGGEKVKIIAKIENREGVMNFDSILDETDGIMVARGDMGVEINPEEVPIIQKELIRKCNLKGKLVITATQMLESMINNPRPTRAEANDVANAIFDGTDCIMLSGETAGGKYPVEAVKMMARIACATENAVDYYKKSGSHTHMEPKTSTTDSIAYASCTIAADIKASCIVAVSRSGFTPRMVSRFKPECLIVAFTHDETVCRQLNLSWGIKPFYYESVGMVEETGKLTLKIVEEKQLVKSGDAVVMVAGFPIGIVGTTNTIKVLTVGDVLLRGKSTMDINVTGRCCVIRTVEDAKNNFKKGDIIIAQNVNHEIMPYIRKASALIIGRAGDDDYDMAITAGQALEIPVVICKEEVVGRIQNAAMITIDSKSGIIYNGVREL
ncbi:pyruvate kinase [Anaeropeptidivorans aminofermentans]|jgi:pyruvate kinase|uniref:pyruvate kinase n=1 Tax=Anaeropeptidivorans aminofermentans TaxID=2934315 RepID=UPI0020252BB5|nr:pyruvate kinase [Anaeropeptidivorans aminofermentans]MBE6011001.1 pyruvate kinase [Lachnospiraceae bacterium]